LKKYITKYYKNLFWATRDIVRVIVSMDATLRADIAQVTEQENVILVQKFSENDVRDAMMLFFR